MQSPLQIEILRRRYQRSIRISITPNGRIQVTAAHSTPHKVLENFIQNHSAWIEACLNKFAELRNRYPAKQYIQGEEFLFLGKKRQLHLIPGSSEKPEIFLQEQVLECRLPICAQHTDVVKKALRDFYREVGRSLLSRRVEYYSEKMQLIPKSVSFRSQKTRWGSCSPDHRISLNWRLVVAPPAALDYVVVHELAHIRHHNHSPAFWSLVAAHAPQFKLMRQWLRKNQYEMDFLAETSELHL